MGLMLAGISVGVATIWSRLRRALWRPSHKERKGPIPLQRAQNIFKESNDYVVNARVERISGDLAGRSYTKSVQLSPYIRSCLGDSHYQPGIT